MMSYGSATYEPKEQANAVEVGYHMDPMVEVNAVIRGLQFKQRQDTKNIDWWVIHILHGGAPHQITMCAEHCNPEIKNLQVGDGIVFTLVDMEVPLGGTGGITVESVKSAKGNPLYQSPGTARYLESRLK